MHEERSTTSKPSRLRFWLTRRKLPSGFRATLTESDVTAYAMCGRFGSTLTVCASPMWTVRPISCGMLTSVMSMISRPPRGLPVSPSVPWSWQRPPASVASSRSWASLPTANGFGALRIPPFGVTSMSCCSESAAEGLLTHEAVGAAETTCGLSSDTWPFCVSRMMVWPPAFGPTASVPTAA